MTFICICKKALNILVSIDGINIRRTAQSAVDLNSQERRDQPKAVIEARARMPEKVKKPHQELHRIR
jgi:hypothetical protein